ncbi:MAG TPA: replication initiation protein, partial [Gammaproteobacteria bacterium]|nr:replication initiation protein [Gammaproteobacteria bacterium]
EHGETPFIAIEEFRKLIGADGSYENFKKLNARVIKPAIAAINRVSDLKVTVDYQRQGRKVVALKFKIRRLLMLPESPQPTLFPDLDDMPAVVKLLTDAGLAMHDALEIWQKGFDMVEPGKRPPAGDNPEEAFVQYVKEKIHLMHQRRASGKLTNPAGFLLSAIKQNYGNARMEQETSGHVRREQAQDLARLQEQQQQVMRQMEDGLHALADQIIETLPELLDEAIAALQAENNALMDRYDVRHTPLHNYRKHPAVAIGVGQWLENRFPERFEKTRHAFAKQLASIEARLLELKGHRATAG